MKLKHRFDETFTFEAIRSMGIVLYDDVRACRTMKRPLYNEKIRSILHKRRRIAYAYSTASGYSGHRNKLAVGVMVDVVTACTPRSRRGSLKRLECVCPQRHSGAENAEMFMLKCLSL